MSNFGRRTWDREDYIGVKPEDKSASFTPVELESLKIKYTNYDKLMHDAVTSLNKKTIATNVTSFKKGKQFGFYCDLCDLTFKDTLQYIDHLNHKLHQLKFEKIFNEPLILDQRDNDDITVKEFEDTYTQLIRDFVKGNKLSGDKLKKVSGIVKVIPSKNTATEENDMTKMMGFTNFGSTKK